jgi:hypothetical protein
MPLQVFVNGKWCELTPLVTPVIIEEEIDRRSDDMIMAQESVYGKATIGVCGYYPVYQYGTYKIGQIRKRS